MDRAKKPTPEINNNFPIFLLSILYSPPHHLLLNFQIPTQASVKSTMKYLATICLILYEAGEFKKDIATYYAWLDTSIPIAITAETRGSIIAENKTKNVAKIANLPVLIINTNCALFGSLNPICISLHYLFGISPEFFLLNSNFQ